MADENFDLITEKRNAKGVIVRTNHYRLIIDQGVRKFERPKGSGFFYDETGKLISAPKKAAVEPMISSEAESLKKKMEELELREKALAEKEASLLAKEETKKEDASLDKFLSQTKEDNFPAMNKYLKDKESKK